jgi:hypothetical protein
MSCSEKFINLLISLASNNFIMYGDQNYVQPGMDNWSEFEDYCDNLSRGVMNRGIAEYYFGTIEMLKTNRDFVQGAVKGGAKNIVALAA